VTKSGADLYPDYVDQLLRLIIAQGHGDTAAVENVVESILEGSDKYRILLRKELPEAFEKAAQLFEQTLPERAALFREAKAIVQELSETLDTIEHELGDNLAATDVTGFQMETFSAFARNKATVASLRATVLLEKLFDTPNYQTYRLSPRFSAALEASTGDRELEVFFLMKARNDVLEKCAHTMADATKPHETTGPTVEEISAAFFLPVQGIDDDPDDKVPRTRHTRSRSFMKKYGPAPGPAPAPAPGPAPAPAPAPGPGGGGGGDVAVDIGPIRAPNSEQNIKNFLVQLYKRSSITDPKGQLLHGILQGLKLAGYGLLGLRYSTDFMDMARFYLVGSAIDAAFRNNSVSRLDIMHRLVAIHADYTSAIEHYRREAVHEVGIAEPTKDPVYKRLFRMVADKALTEVLLEDVSYRNGLNAVLLFDIAAMVGSIGNSFLLHGIGERFFPNLYTQAPVSEDARPSDYSPFAYMRMLTRMFLGLEDFPSSHQNMPKTVDGFSGILANVADGDQVALFLSKLDAPGVSLSQEYSVTGNGDTYLTYTDGTTAGATIYAPPSLVAWSKNANFRELVGLPSSAWVSVADFSKRLAEAIRGSVRAYPNLCESLSFMQLGAKDGSITALLGKSLQMLSVTRETVVATTIAAGLLATSVYFGGNAVAAVAPSSLIGKIVTIGAMQFVGYRAGLVFDMAWRTAGILSTEFQELSYNQLQSMGLGEGTLPLVDTNIDPALLDDEIAKEKHARSVNNGGKVVMTWIRRNNLRFLKMISNKVSSRLLRVPIGFMMELNGANMFESIQVTRGYKGTRPLGRLQAPLERVVSIENISKANLAIEVIFGVGLLGTMVVPAVTGGYDKLAGQVPHLMYILSILLGAGIGGVFTGKNGFLAYLGAMGTIMKTPLHFYDPRAQATPDALVVLTASYALSTGVRYFWDRGTLKDKIPALPPTTIVNTTTLSKTDSRRRKSDVPSTQAVQQAVIAVEKSFFETIQEAVTSLLPASQFTRLMMYLVVAGVVTFFIQLTGRIVDSYSRNSYLSTSSPLTINEHANVAVHLARVHTRTLARPHLRLAFTDF
jgi:hypothetical protein